MLWQFLSAFIFIGGRIYDYLILTTGINSVKRITSFSFYDRQKSSFDDAKKYYGSSVTNIATSDTAFLLDVLKPENCLESTYDVVVQLRKDLESRFNLSEVSQTNPKDKDENYISAKLCQFLIAKGIVRTCKPIAWLTPLTTRIDRTRGMPEFLLSCLQQATGALSLGRVVITDRLHGTLVSYL